MLLVHADGYNLNAVRQHDSKFNDQSLHIGLFASFFDDKSRDNQYQVITKNRMMLHFYHFYTKPPKNVGKQTYANMVSCTLDFPNKSNPFVSVEAVDTACVHHSYLGLQGGFSGET